MSIESKVALSTDCTGVFGKPPTWKEVWQPSIDLLNKNNIQFAGYEMIGWGGRYFKGWTVSLYEQAIKENCRISGIHGRTGGVHDTHNLKDRVQLGLVNRLLIPTRKLIKDYGDKVDYVLVHTPELRSKKVRKLLASDESLVNRLMIENHIRTGGLGGATEVARSLRRTDGVKTGVMFDLSHYFYAYDHLNIDAAFDNVLGELEYLFGNLKEDNGEPIPVAIHLPVGKRDSLPLGRISDQKLKKLGGVLKKRPDMFIVIENQQSGMDRFFLTNKSIKALKERNVKIIERLIRTEVV